MLFLDVALLWLPSQFLLVLGGDLEKEEIIEAHIARIVGEQRQGALDSGLTDLIPVSFKDCSIHTLQPHLQGRRGGVGWLSARGILFQLEFRVVLRNLLEGLSSSSLSENTKLQPHSEGLRTTQTHDPHEKSCVEWGQMFLLKNSNKPCCGFFFFFFEGACVGVESA